MKTTKQKKGAAPLLLGNGSRSEPDRAEIARRAYSLWEQQGRPQDQDLGLWLQAEAQLRQSRTSHDVPA